jgi:putative hemolysin
MSSVGSAILIVLLLVLANGLFSMSEMAIVSSRKVRLQQAAERGDRRAQVALELANSPTRFLSTVQVGITLIGVVVGIFSGKTFEEPLKAAIENIGLLKPYAAVLSLTLVALATTYLSLIIGELVPKQIALSNPEAIAISVATPMAALSRITSPAVGLLSASSGLVLKLLNIVPSSDPEVTEEEIRVLIQQGTEAGTFEEAEQEIVERVFELGDRRVNAIMTPRPDIIWLDLDDSVDANKLKLVDSSYTRLPVCSEGLDNVLGILQVNDLLTQSLNGQPLDFTTSLRQPLFIPESTRSLKVLELFKESSVQVALVVDEYGVIQGLVTLDDILEAIVGDLPSTDDEDDQAVQREDGSWLLDGMMAVEEFRELFDLDNELPGEQRGNYHTLGGFIITHLGRIPRTSDHFEWNQMRFEVMDMDGNRVDKILVLPIVAKAPADGYDG